MNKIVSMDDIIPLMKEQINNNGEVAFTPKGNSMLPMLRSNKDIVTLCKAQFPLKKYDLPLYVRGNGKYVLHRVIGVEKDSYVMRGDNQFLNEPDIREEQIIGVVHSFTRKNKRYNCDSRTYMLYCRIWVNTVEIRKVLRIMRRIAGKIKRKVLRMFR